MNGQLWESYERGEISRDTVLYTRFGRVFEHFGIDADGIAFEHDYRKELDEGHDLMEGAMELVQTLAPLYELYIVTNGTTETQYKRLGDSGLSPYFKDIFISGEIGSRKPMKAFFDHCFEKAPHLSPEDVLIIGDSLSSDILGGNKVVLVGSLIQDQLIKAHNTPFAAALSVVLMLMTTLMIALYRKISGVKDLEGLV